MKYERQASRVVFLGRPMATVEVQRIRRIWTLELEGMPESWSHSTSQVPPEIVSWFESPSVHSFSLKVLNTRHTKDVGEGHAYI